MKLKPPEKIKVDLAVNCTCHDDPQDDPELHRHWGENVRNLDNFTNKPQRSLRGASLGHKVLLSLKSALDSMDMKEKAKKSTLDIALPCKSGKHRSVSGRVVYKWILS